MYWHEIRAKFKRLPVWLPATPIALGDVGLLSPSKWTKETTLTKLGITVKRGQKGVPTDHDYSSAHGVTIDTQLSGESSAIAGLQPGEAGFFATFSRSGACVFKVAQVRVRGIDNLHEVEQAILALHAAGKWKPDWTYVTETAQGGPACVLVAAHATASAVVSFGLDLPTGTASLVSAKAGLRLGPRKDLSAGFVTTKPTTVLWSGRYVRDPLFRTPRGEDRGEPITSTTTESPRIAPIESPTDNLPTGKS
jgi:hypothetical protein